MTDQAVLKWRKEGKYLPKFMRDFHDQKDLFKSIHDTIAVEKHGQCKDINWIQGHCYVIDVFLWHMARHGYVLRKSETRLPYDDLNETTQRSNDRANAYMDEILGIMLSREEEEKSDG